MPINDWTPTTVYVANSGAAGTFLARLDVTDFAYHGDGPPLWSGISETMPPGSSGIGTGAVFERGDAQSGTAYAYLTRAPDVTTPEEVARRVGNLRGVELTIRWAFRRPRLLRPWRRETTARHVRVFFDGSTYRERCIAEWRKAEEARHLADVAEGREPPPSSMPS